MPSASHAFCFDEAGAVSGINPGLLKGIAKIESGLNQNAVNINSNGSRDMGLMQINSSWVSSIGIDQARLMSDPCYNVMTGAKILKMCIDRHGYEWKAVGCYNAVSRDKRVDYSWKVYNLLRKMEAAESGNKLTVTSNKKAVTSNELQVTSKEDSTNSSLVTEPALSLSKGQFSFSVRDTAAIE